MSYYIKSYKQHSYFRYNVHFNHWWLFRTPSLYSGRLTIHMYIQQPCIDPRLRNSSQEPLLCYQLPKTYHQKSNCKERLPPLSFPFSVNVLLCTSTISHFSILLQSPRPIFRNSMDRLRYNNKHNNPTNHY